MHADERRSVIAFLLSSICVYPRPSAVQSVVFARRGFRGLTPPVQMKAELLAEGEVLQLAHDAGPFAARDDAGDLLGAVAACNAQVLQRRVVLQLAHG